MKDISLYYEVHRSGYPLVLIRGLASNADHWYCRVPAFSSHYSVAVFETPARPAIPVSRLPAAARCALPSGVPLCVFLSVFFSRFSFASTDWPVPQPVINLII